MPEKRNQNQWATEAILYGLLLCVALFYSVRLIGHQDASLPAFWDARVYAKALFSWSAGLDPYAFGTYVPGRTFLFVSPPVFLYLMALTRHLVPGHLGFWVYLAASVAATLAIPAILAKYYLRSSWFTAPLCLLVFCFQPNHHGLQALLTGNVTNLLYAFVLLGAVPGLRSERWRWFYAALVLSGLIKPMFLSFLLLPLFAGKRQWLQSCAAAATVIAGYAIQVFGMRSLYRAFQRNVYTQIFEHGDAGFGLLAQSRLHGHRIPVFRRLGSMAEAGLLILALLVLVGISYWGKTRRKQEALFVPGLLVMAVLCNPRIQAYDADVSVLPAIFIVIEICRRLPQNRWKAFWIGVPATLFWVQVGNQADTADCYLLVFAVLLACWEVSGHFRTFVEGVSTRSGLPKANAGTAHA